MSGSLFAEASIGDPDGSGNAILFTINFVPASAVATIYLRDWQESDDQSTSTAAVFEFTHRNADGSDEQLAPTPLEGVEFSGVGFDPAMSSATFLCEVFHTVAEWTVQILMS